MLRFKLFIRVTFLLIVLITCSLYFTSNVLAQVSYVEYFSNYDELNSDLWNYIRLDKSIFDSDVSHSYLIFSGVNDSLFQYLRSNQLENIPNDFSIRFYIIDKGVDQGAGIAVSDVIQIDGQSPNFNSYLFYIWPKPDGTYHLFTTLCPITNPSCNIATQLSSGVYDVRANTWQELTITKNSDFGSYKVSLNGSIIFESIYSNRNIRYLMIGNSIGNTNTESLWPKFYIDEVAINTDLSIINQESFPYYSQIDPLWRDIEYDSGNTWNNPGQGTIGRWGCAITSVSMLLKKYGINMPDGSEPTPLVLNSWLKSQPDGYVGGGLLNWLAITRLAHSSHLVGQAPKELEFIKSYGSPSDELSLGYYPILNTGKHFVIAHKENTLDYTINDPLSKLITALPKSTTLSSVNTFIPSETDLSYILLVADPSINLTFPNSIYFDETLSDEDNSSTIRKRLYYVRKPDLKTYKVVAQGLEGDEIEAYLYNQIGEVAVDKVTLVSNEPTSFVINYDPRSVSNKVIVDSKPVLDYLRSQRNLKSPFNGIMQALYSKFVDYFSYISQGIETSRYSRDLLSFVNKQSPKHIPYDVKTTVQKYIRLIEAN